MAIKSGLIALSNAVAAYFAAQGITATVAAVGWRQRAQQINQGAGGANRVLFLPGDEQGRGGKLELPRLMSVNPRPLAQWSKLVTCSIWQVDTIDTYDEQRQIEAVETLLEQTVQGIHNFGLADVTWGDVRWTVENTEMYFGRELLLSFIHKGPLFDVTLETCTPQPAVRRDPFIP